MSGWRLAAALLALLALAAALQGGVAPEVRYGLAAAVAALALAAALTPALGEVPRSAVVLALAWSALAVGSVVWSVAPDAALDGAAAAMAALLALLLGASLDSARERRGFVLGFAGLGALVACVAVGAVVPGQRASFPFGNANHLGGWLLLPAGVALAYVVRGKPLRRGRRESGLLGIGLLAVCGAGIVASRSRGAGLAAAAALIATVGLDRLGPRRVLPLSAAAWGAVALALAVLPVIRPGLVPAKEATGESSAGMRWAVYGAATRTALVEAPIGTGLGGFAPAFRARRPAAVPYSVRFAHSEPLEGAVELGLPFVVLLVGTGVVAVRRAARGLGRASRAAWGAAAALLGLAAHSLVDFPLHVPAIALGGATLAGVAWRATGFRDEERRRAGRASRAALAVLGLLVAALAVTGELALRAEHLASADLARGAFESAERAARDGLRARPECVALLRTLAQAEEAQARLAGGGAALARAVATRRRAVEASPRDADLRVEEARTLVAAGHVRQAVAALDAAATLDPNSAAVALGRASLLVQVGRARAAADAVRVAIERDPALSAAASAALLTDTGDPELVRRAVPAVAAPLRNAGRVLERAGHVRAGAASLSRAFALAPSDTGLALETARAWLHAGLPERAEGILTRALANRPGDPRLARELARARRARRNASAAAGASRS